MPDLSFSKQISYTLLGYIYWFTYRTSTRRLVGLRYSTLLKSGLILLLLLAWLRDWGQTTLIILLSVTIVIFIIYWLARRAGYFRFIPGPENRMGSAEVLSTLSYYERVAARATGVFSLETWEKQVLFRPAEYWQVPRGGHAVMVAHQPGRYLYQFFDAASLLSLQQGWILYGRHPAPALAISFRSIWGPELAVEPFTFFARAREEPQPLQRVIYLSFENAAHEQKVWQNIVADARRARQTGAAV